MPCSAARSSAALPSARAFSPGARRRSFRARGAFFAPQTFCAKTACAARSSSRAAASARTSTSAPCRKNLTSRTSCSPSSPRSSRIRRSRRSKISPRSTRLIAATAFSSSAAARRWTQPRPPRRASRGRDKPLSQLVGLLKVCRRIPPAHRRAHDGGHGVGDDHRRRCHRQ